MSMCLCEWRYTWACAPRCPLRTEEGVRFLVPGVIGACEPTDMALGSTFGFSC